ncbi:MAG: SRPBCC family protein [Flavipsychrobacter sp.]
MTSDLLFDFSVNKETKTVHILRELNAPLELVWDAWTKPELLDQWWGPDPLCVENKVYELCTWRATVFCHDNAGKTGAVAGSKVHFHQPENPFQDAEHFCGQR